MGWEKDWHEPAWMRRSVPTVWVQGKSWKWAGRRAGGHERVRTVWVKGKIGNGWGEGPVGMSARGCADGGCADVSRRYGCKGKVGNG